MLPTRQQTSSIPFPAFQPGGCAVAAVTSAGLMESEQTDPLLVPFVRAPSGAECERLLATLITEHAEPLISKIVNYKMRAGRRGGAAGDTLTESEDIHGEVMLQLVQRLQHFRADHAVRPIKDFNAYVAVTTYNACDRFVSRKYPQRRRLKNGLRYLLTHRAGFGLWRNGRDEWVGGLHEWRAGSTVGSVSAEVGDATARRLEELRDDPRAFAREEGTGRRDLSDRKRGVELLGAVFAWTGAPVELDLLTGVFAEWWGVTDEQSVIEDGSYAEEGTESRGVQLADSRPQPSVEAERRIYLERLWSEIVELPPRQRAALLFNLRDEGGRGVVDLWMLTGVATPQQISAALDMTPDGFAEIWNDLPMDDNAIAAHLGLTRQQIINLRKSARERLARRMKGF